MNHRMSEKYMSFFAGVILLVTIIFTVGTYYNHDIIGGMFALELSDTMYLPTIFRDLMLENGKYADWYFAPAPYFFPDMFLYFISGFINNDYYHSNLIFILLQKIIFFLAIFAVFNNFYSKNISFMLASIIIAIFYMVPTSFSTLLIKGNWHFGVTLVGLMVVSMLLGTIGTKNNMMKLLLVFIFSTLCVASDKLFILQFVVPIVLTLTVMLGFKIIDMSYWFIVSGLFILSVFFGYLIYDILMVHKTAYSIQYSFSNIYPNSLILAEKISQYLSSNLLFAVINIGLILSIMWKSTKMLVLTKYEISIKVFFIGVLFSISAPLTIGVLLISDLEMAFRYLIPINFLASITMLSCYSMGINTIIKSYKKQVMVLVILLSIVPSVGWTFYKLKSFKYENEYYPSHFKCVDQFLTGKNVKVGVGNYWVSKRFAMINKLGFKVVNVNKNLSEINRISTAGWNKESYDFVISNKRWNNNPDISLIVKRNKLIKYTQKSCGFIEVYHFENGFNLK